GLGGARRGGRGRGDLQPETLFRSRDGAVKILDFGLAKVVPAPWVDPEAKTESGTQPGAVLGTVGYMSPEQVRGRPADSRSDIFSFGAILYEGIVGRRAFHGDSAIETLNAILTEEPPEPSGDAGGAISPLERIARRCMEKDPHDRFQNAADIAFALEAYSGPIARVSDETRGTRGGRRSVAVLPFQDVSPDQDNVDLRLGLAAATVPPVALLRPLLVRPPRAVASYPAPVVAPAEVRPT